MSKYGNLDPSDWLSALLNTYSRNDSIKLYIDTTNAVPTYYSVIHTFIAFQKALDENQDMFPNLIRQNNLLGIKLVDPINGSFDVKYKDSMVCGQMVFLTLFFSLLFTALILNIKRTSGVKHRDTVTGITKNGIYQSLYSYLVLLSNDIYNIDCGHHANILPITAPEQTIRVHFSNVGGEC